MAKALSLFETLRKEVQTRGYDARSRQSLSWFQGKVQELTGNVNRNTLLSDTALKLKREPVWGQMFMFVYDAKGKDELPYWDKFPLMIMTEPAKVGFYGLNLHYLEPMVRAAFLDKLMETLGPKDKNYNTRLSVRYDLLRKVRKFREFRPCFKHYLGDHIVSKVVQVSAEDWPTAIFLPTDDFQKVSSQKVWAESKKQYLST